MIYLVRLLLGCEQSPGSGYLSSVRKTTYPYVFTKNKFNEVLKSVLVKITCKC